MRYERLRKHATSQVIEDGVYNRPFHDLSKILSRDNLDSEWPMLKDQYCKYPVNLTAR